MGIISISKPNIKMFQNTDNYYMKILKSISIINSIEIAS